MALRILHTADWHLGMRHLNFEEQDRLKLTRARLEAVEAILARAQSLKVHAVLCAGDLFDEPAPASEWTQGLAKLLSKPLGEPCPVFLLPGNHDPLIGTSVYAAGHPFRKALPPWVHVVDRDDFEFPLGDNAVLYARPCRSHAGDVDQALALPARLAGDTRVRIGMVHGQTFDMDGYQSNFPIAKDACEQRGLDYLALGDTHGLRVMGTKRRPMVYPGAPEPTRFGEQDTGHVVLVQFSATGEPMVHKQKVGSWRWRDEAIGSLAELQRLLDEDLAKTVLQLRLNLRVTLAERQELLDLLRTLAGSEASHPRVGVLLESREVSVDTADLRFLDGLPDVIKKAAQRLQADGTEQARRALCHLHSVVWKAKA